MCGIAGAIGRIDSEIVAAVRRMNDRQAHRGPDADGFWTDSANGQGIANVAFAHRRLAIIDLSPAGRQPMIDSTTGNAIVFNGEVFNFMELRAELERDGVEVESRSDTEVILKGYAHWGEAMISRLRGMFALVIWDAQKRRALFLRDRLGIKPLYHATVERSGGKVLLFASEVRSLLASGLIPHHMDPVAARSYLSNGFVVGPRTIVEGVHLFPQAHAATVAPDSPVIAPRRYWSIPSYDARRAPPAAEGKRALERELEEAVRLRLVSDVPLGIFLSGGVDSSAVAALAVRASSGKIATFNISFDEAAFDESRYARAVAQALGTEYNEVRLTQSSFRSGLGDALDSIDQPTFDAINTFFVSRAVRQAGITVALAGTGGDELFGGYKSFTDLPRAMRVGRLFAPVPTAWWQPAASAVIRLKHGRARGVPPQTRWGKLEDVLATRGDLVDLYQVSYAQFTNQFLGELAHPSGGPPLPTGLTPERTHELRELVRNNPILHSISMLELSMFIGERLLRDTDAASMAVALEARVPLLDHLVIERISELSPRERYGTVGTKSLLRELALRELDPGLFDRPKSGFVLPIGPWCRSELREEVDRLMGDRELCESVGLNAEAVSRLWSAFQSDAPGLYWSRVWGIFVLLWWSRRYGVSLRARTRPDAAA
jgi:asparagine synthase (glutamine-hydrolysing)